MTAARKPRAKPGRHLPRTRCDIPEGDGFAFRPMKRLGRYSKKRGGGWSIPTSRLIFRRTRRCNAVPYPLEQSATRPARISRSCCRSWPVTCSTRDSKFNGRHCCKVWRGTVKHFSPESWSTPSDSVTPTCRQPVRSAKNSTHGCSDKLFIGVEDIYVPDQKIEVLEILKPMITGTRLARRAMQQDQVMHDVCANLFSTRTTKTPSKRPCATVVSACSTPRNKSRLTWSVTVWTEITPRLYNWARNGGFAAITWHLQQHYAIPVEFNPTGSCQRAPVTSSTEEAVEASLGGIEQEIMEAIEEGRTGFAGGWVSSFALDKLIGQVTRRTADPARQAPRPDALARV